MGKGGSDLVEKNRDASWRRERGVGLLRAGGIEPMRAHPVSPVTPLRHPCATVFDRSRSFDASTVSRYQCLCSMLQKKNAAALFPSPIKIERRKERYKIRLARRSFQAFVPVSTFFETKRTAESEF